MVATDEGKFQQLNILHCFRSPVGGIFRHVRDLIHEQVRQGHKVGVICDNNTGGPFEENLLAALEPSLELGLFRIPMKRAIGPRDIMVSWSLYKKIKGMNPDILHSHGAKGGAHARIIGTALRKFGNRPVRLYCPHGGSIHYDHNTLSGRIYFGLERILERFTDRLIFVSDYERQGYFSKVGKSHCPHSLARNGLTEDEFTPIPTADDATDFVYIGMMRDLKGVDLFLETLPVIAERLSRQVSATLVGNGPDLEAYKERAAQLGDGVTTRFFDSMPVSDAFPLGKTLVVPSRAESLPDIVLEALAAQRPLIATHVGGIPEIYAEYSEALVNGDDLGSLTDTMAGVLAGNVHLPDIKMMAERVKSNFSAKIMADDVMESYLATLNP